MERIVGYVAVLFGLSQQEAYALLALGVFLLFFIIGGTMFKPRERNERREPPAPPERKAKPKEPPKWYPTGWTYNTEKGEWEPPDFPQK